MRKIPAILLTLAMAAGMAMPAAAESLLPYEGEQVTWEGYAADLGINEDRESPAYKEYSSKLGNMSIEWSTAPWADFDTKTSMFLNTGDLPDVVWLRGSTDVISNYGEMGYFLNFMDYLDYMPHLAAYLEEFPQVARMVTDDGKLYCLNDIEPYDYVDEAFYVNKTELEKLGKEVPRTWDEMLDCMRAYKEANPEGTPFITYGWGESYYENALGSILNAKTGFYYDDKDETWKYAITSEDSHYKELIEMFSTMYSEGLLHPEFSTMEDGTAYQICMDGNWLFSFWYMGTIVNEIYVGTEPPFEYEAMVAPAYKEGDPHYNVVTSQFDGVPGWGYFVNADVKEPELLCSYLDFVISEDASTIFNWGIEDLTYTVDADGNKQFAEEYKTSEERKKVGVGNFMDVRYIQYKLRNTEYAAGNEDKKSTYDMIISGLEDGSIVGIRALRGKPQFTPEENEIVAQITTPVSTYVKENIMLFIDGTRDLSEWDSFVEEVKSVGDLDELISVYNGAKQVELSQEGRYAVYNK